MKNFVHIFLLVFASTKLSTASGRKCYKCLVRNGCLKLDIHEVNSTVDCVKGVEHCVTSTTVSKVTGAVAIDYLCGGRVYQVDKPAFKEGCFSSDLSQESRTTRTDCYCSADLCNTGVVYRLNRGLCISLVFLIYFIWVYL